MAYFGSPSVPISDLPDSAEERFAFLLAGEAEGVKNATKRYAGWHGKYLLPLTALSIFFAVAALGWLVGFAGVLASASGLAINCLAKKSCHEQLKAEKKSHSDEAAGRFLERLFDSIQRLAWATASDVKIANFLKYVRTISIEAIQRSIEALAGLVHLALANQLLPIPVTQR